MLPDNRIKSHRSVFTRRNDKILHDDYLVITHSRYSLVTHGQSYKENQEIEKQEHKNNISRKGNTRIYS